MRYPPIRYPPLLKASKCSHPPVRASLAGARRPILNLDGTGPLDMVTATSWEGDELASGPGLVMEIGLRYAAGRPRSAARVPAGLQAKSCRTGADFAAYSAGHTILHR
ncbi:hypothetical protein WEI85_03120 [Actinomycetes bacterium KLBMP 9797]